LGDTGYDSNGYRLAIGKRGMQPVIRSKPDRRKKPRVATKLYRQRYRVELFFHRLKRVRALATRYEKSARNYLALLAHRVHNCLAGAVIVVVIVVVDIGPRARRLLCPSKATRRRRSVKN